MTKNAVWPGGGIIPYKLGVYSSSFATTRQYGNISENNSLYVTEPPQPAPNLPESKLREVLSFVPLNLHESKVIRHLLISNWKCGFRLCNLRFWIEVLVWKNNTNSAKKDRLSVEIIRFRAVHPPTVSVYRSLSVLCSIIPFPFLGLVGRLQTALSQCWMGVGIQRGTWVTLCVHENRVDAVWAHFRHAYWVIDTAMRDGFEPREIQVWDSLTPSAGICC